MAESAAATRADGPVECAACRGAWPSPSHRIADCGLAVAYLHEDQFFPGWSVLVLKRHATELFELSREERARLTEEVTTLARALATAFAARKVNYALLGNLLPHVHWHVIPRLADDPVPREPVWSLRHEPRRLDAGELDARLALVRGHLAPAVSRA